MKVFLAGAVSSADERQLKKYNTYKKIILELFNEIDLTTPDDIWEYRDKCIKENPQYGKIQIDKLMVDYDLKQVKESDLIICDLSEVSTGMGLELGVAHENKLNVIFFYEMGSYISNMITGAFENSDFIEYKDVFDLTDKLKKFLGK